MKRLLILFSLFIFYSFPINTMNEKIGKATQHDKVESFSIKVPKSIVIDKNLKPLMNAMAWKESTNDHTKINTTNHIGLYQFGQSTLKTLGYNIPVDSFIRNPSIFPKEIQHEAFYKNYKRNAKILSDIIIIYDSTYIDGKLITKNGILAAAHLSGPYGVINFFEKKEDKKDLNGTSIKDYLFAFSSF